MLPKNYWSYFEYQKSDKIVLEGLITRFPIQENKDHKKCWQDSGLIYILLERLSFVVVNLTGGTRGVCEETEPVTGHVSIRYGG